MDYFLCPPVCMKYNIHKEFFTQLKQILYSLKVGGIMNYMLPYVLSRRVLVCMLSGLLPIVATAAAQSVQSNTFEGWYSATELARVDALLEESMRAGALPGIVAGITTNSNTLYVRARGLRRLDLYSDR